MSRADWSSLELLLEQGREYSTSVGQAWLTVLLLFRVLVLSTAAESVWGDEQSEFVCNTLQPGCEEVCYDKAFPISHFRFFVMQIIAVASPTIFYLSYAMLQASWERKRRERLEDEDRRAVGTGEGMERGTEATGRGERETPPKRPRLRGRLLRVCLSITVLKLLLEAGFILILWYVYGFTVPAHYVCERWPCPHAVDCFVSRPKEKTLFTLYMQAMAGVSLFFNLLEVCALIRRYCLKPTRIIPKPLPLPAESVRLHLPGGKGGVMPYWQAGTDWHSWYSIGQEPKILAPPPSFAQALPGPQRGSMFAQWQCPPRWQQSGASL